MKIVLDTNVFIAAFISKGHCTDVYEYIVLHHTLYISQQIIKELSHNLQKKFHFTKKEITDITEFIQQHAEMIHPVPQLKQRVSRDRADDGILALAYLATTDAIITGDKDLLVLKQFQGIPIIQPKGFWKFESAKSI